MGNEMNERSKVEEAEYFFKQILISKNDRKIYHFNLSAFLSAGRSVVQYIYEKAKSKPTGQSWYDKTIKEYPIIGYLKDKRDENIHTAPISANNDVTIKLGEGKTEYRFFFKDGDTEKDVENLAKKYIEALNNFINDAMENNILNNR